MNHTSIKNVRGSSPTYFWPSAVGFIASLNQMSGYSQEDGINGLVLTSRLVPNLPLLVEMSGLPRCLQHANMETKVFMC